MSRSKPFDLVQMLKSLWESHPLNRGRVYSGTSRDMMEAKGWLLVNEWHSGDFVDFEERMDRFMRSDFEGWKEQDYPIWAFLRHYNRYAPPRKTNVIEVTRRSTRYCGDCGTYHSINTPCQGLRLAQ